MIRVYIKWNSLTKQNPMILVDVVKSDKVIDKPTILEEPIDFADKNILAVYSKVLAKASKYAKENNIAKVYIFLCQGTLERYSDFSSSPDYPKVPKSDYPEVPKSKYDFTLGEVDELIKYCDNNDMTGVYKNPLLKNGIYLSEKCLVKEQ